MTKAGQRPIVFDYGGVVQKLLDDELCHLIAQELHVSPDDLKPYFNSAIREVQRGAMSEDDFVRVAAEMTGATASIAAEALFTKPFEHDSQLFPQVIVLLEELRDQGIPLSVLSNTVPSHARLNRRRNNYRWFGNRVFLSCEIKLLKPSFEVFEWVASRLEVPLSGFLLVDDMAENATAARELGIVAIQHDSASMPIEHLRVSLAGLGFAAL